MAPPRSGSSTTDSRWNLEMLVFVEGGKPENPEKNPRSKDENQQQTKPTYDTGTGNLIVAYCKHVLSDITVQIRWTNKKYSETMLFILIPKR